MDVPLISQNPELKNGCEVTSLAMVLQYAGIKVNKLELANSIKKENEKLISEKEEITSIGEIPKMVLSGI